MRDAGLFFTPPTKAPTLIPGEAGELLKAAVKAVPEKYLFYGMFPYPPARK